MTRPVVVGSALTLMFWTAAVVAYRQLRDGRAKSRLQSTIALCLCAAMGSYALGATVVAVVRG